MAHSARCAAFALFFTQLLCYSLHASRHRAPRNFANCYIFNSCLRNKYVG
jgi:hypothetical protein